MSITITAVDRWRKEEIKKAVAVGIATGRLYRGTVTPGDLGSVERWINAALPPLLRANRASARSAAKFYDLLREIELAKLEIDAEPYKAEPVLKTLDGGIRYSLMTSGKTQYTRTANSDWDPSRMNENAIAGTVIRHVLNGGRATIDHNSQQDKAALGWVRVTDGNPCAFCAMLASRGVTYRPYKKDAFTASNARYEGSGEAKVHNSCGCGLKPVWSLDDDVLAQNKRFESLWTDMAGTTTRTAFSQFRKNYEAAGLHKHS